jgi:hypothetical protein
MGFNMNFVLDLLNRFSGPIGGLVEKGLLVGVTWAFAQGKISGDAAGIAASLYAAFSATFTALVNTQNGKAHSIVTTQGNGITVVPKQAAVSASIPSVTETQ